MTVIWQKNVDGVVHQVRTAGNTRRLYTGGVFHSQYNPRHPVGGHLWDLLMLPAFFADDDSIQRILVLGSGGGAVMQQLNYFLSPEIIVGVDINPEHHYVARRYFGINGDPFKLIESDAEKWLSQYQDEPFDLIIDDLYGEHQGEPQRAIDCNPVWFKKLHDLLSMNGLLVMNFISLSGLKSSGWWKDQATRCLFLSTFRLSMENYENIIGVFSRREVNADGFRRRLRQYPELDQRRKTTKLKYRLRRLN
jgi:predicted membrane-bound spermidine synthase